MDCSVDCTRIDLGCAACLKLSLNSVDGEEAEIRECPIPPAIAPIKQRSTTGMDFITDRISVSVPLAEGSADFITEDESVAEEKQRLLGFLISGLCFLLGAERRSLLLEKNRLKSSVSIGFRGYEIRRRAIEDDESAEKEEGFVAISTMWMEDEWD